VGSGFVPHRQIFFQKKALHMTTSALIASKTPFAAEVEAGKDYYWCSCGRSQSQPFCDGKHQGTTVYFCGCKQSAAGQFCDGAHQKLG
jgi:CDGSH iron-sulfur domain-containing protein 3